MYIERSARGLASASSHRAASAASNAANSTASYAKRKADIAKQLKGAGGLATASVTLGGQRALEMQYWTASFLGWEQTREVSTVI